MEEKFNNSDDFGVDYGEFEDDIGNLGSFGVEVNTEEFNLSNRRGMNDNVSGKNNSIEDDKDYKKTAKIAIVSGIVIIILALTLFSLIGKKKQNDVNANKEINNNINQSQSVNSGSIEENEINLEKYTTPKETVKETIIERDRDGWIVIGQDNSLTLNETAEALFTVINITHMAKVVNENKDVQIKSLVKGNISGVSGTFELNMPYDKAKYLDIGTVFTIEYKFTSKNNSKIIGEVVY